MARVPVITSACPLRWNSAPQPGKDFCGHCQRRVHNLDLLGDAERQAFLAGCEGKVCVSYTVRRPKSVLGLGLMATGALVAGSAAADPYATPVVAGEYCDAITEVVLVGGTNAAKAVEWIDEQEAAVPAKSDLPEIGTSDWLPSPIDGSEPASS